MTLFFGQAVYKHINLKTDHIFMTLVPHHINWPPQRETQLNMCFLTINPTDGYNLKERKKQDGHYSGVIVHQLENIDSHLNRDTVFRTAGM